MKRGRQGVTLYLILAAVFVFGTLTSAKVPDAIGYIDLPNGANSGWTQHLLPYTPKGKAVIALRWTESLPNYSHDISRLLHKFGLKSISDTLGAASISQSTIVLDGSETDYIKSIERHFGIVDAAYIENHTGGFAVGTTVYIPMYKYWGTSDPYLLNTLIHELTHVSMHEMELDRRLPVWLVEGAAWYAGLRAQAEVDNRSAALVVRQLLEPLESAAQGQRLVPLSASTMEILSNDVVYNVEFEDYLAVKTLIDWQGLAQFRLFLHSVALHGLESGFHDIYGMTLIEYETRFLNALVNESRTYAPRTVH